MPSGTADSGHIVDWGNALADLADSAEMEDEIVVMGAKFDLKVVAAVSQ